MQLNNVKIGCEDELGFQTENGPFSVLTFEMDFPEVLESLIRERIDAGHLGELYSETEGWAEFDDFVLTIEGSRAKISIFSETKVSPTKFFAAVEMIKAL